MSFFGVMLFFFIFAAVLGTALAYAKALQKTRAYRQKRIKYETLTGSLPQLKDHILTEADRWPIYARPVVFTEIDHEAQIEFAKAQQALQEVDLLAPEIETIPEPETSEKFNLRSLFYLKKNLRTISIGNQLIGNVDVFANMVGSLENSVKTLRADWYKAEKKRREVRQAIKELRRNITSVNAKLKSMETWDTSAINQISWAINVADNCHCQPPIFHTREK